MSPSLRQLLAALDTIDREALPDIRDRDECLQIWIDSERLRKRIRIFLTRIQKKEPNT